MPIAHLWKLQQCIFTRLNLLIVLFFSSATYAQQTIDSNKLHTWWHSNFELNDTTPVADANVRRSTIYDVRVSSQSAPSIYYDSYTYMSIPRGGREKWGYTDNDGAEFADQANLSMSWSSFLYSEDASIEVDLRNGQTISSINDVIIRPLALNLTKQWVDTNTIRIKVPYSSKGVKFSVEFAPQLFTAYNDMNGNSGNLTTVASGNTEVHREPQNSLMIFAEPILTGADANRLIPHESDGSIYYPPEGEVNNLNTVSADIIYFKPGTYYMPWNYHALLPANVKWVYLAPGAFVKGAFRFVHDNQGVYKVTGYGALSGEKYVYEPDTENGYKHLVKIEGHDNCHSSCVKMLQFQSSSNMQHFLDLQGITIVEPPYHSFVVYGDDNKFEMRVENYKQVGSWYWQTDGLELYTNSRMNNTFFHSNDDVLKLYHSNVTVDNTTIWKNENGPVIQWGWIPRNIENISVKNTYIIHNRMYWKDKKINTCIFNASPQHDNQSSTTTADTNTLIKNLVFENIQVEGKTNCAIRLYSLSNLETVYIKNLSIDDWSDLGAAGNESEFKTYTNSSAQKVFIGNESINGKGLKLENYRVAGQLITRSNNNWNSTSLGKLNFDGELFDNWNAWASSSSSSATSVSSASSSSSAPSDNWFFRGTPNNWNTTPMTFQNGLYCTQQSFGAANTNPRFKIDHFANWAESYPASDVGVSANTTHKICFNATTKTISVTSATSSSSNAASSSSSSSTPNGGNVNVHFVCNNGITYNGQSVYVVGNISALGNWNLAQAIKLDPVNYPKWEGDISLPANTPIQWKCVKREELNPSAGIVWQGGSNISVNTGTGITTTGGF